MGTGIRRALRLFVVPGAALLLFAALALWHPLGAYAATITVNNLSDSTVLGDGVSLREAINSINGGADVDGDVAANRTGAYGTNDAIIFPTGFSGTITLTGGTLTLTANVAITGPGADRLTVDGGCTGCDAPATPPTDGVTVVQVNSGVTAAIGNLTVRHGATQAPNGAGGIVNHGTLTLTGMAVTANVASFGFRNAGGVYNDGALTVTSSTLAANAMVFPGAFSAAGLASNGGTVGLTNVTIAGNTSGAAPFALSGIQVTGGTATVTNGTITANSTQDAGAAGTFSGGTLTLTNTIVAGNTSGFCGDIRGPVISGGHNLIGDTACGSGITDGVNGDIVNPAPLLGPLNGNGGPTQTVALLATSPALNVAACTGAGVPGTDQRGVPRPQGTGCDIGAYELQVTAIGTTTALTAALPAATPTTTVTLTAVATASTGSAAPVGTVSFTDNGTPIATIGLDATGTASLSRTFAAGPHALAATYNGQALAQAQIGFSSSTGNAPLTIAPIVLVVNSTADGPEDATRCLQGNANTCRLRDAIMAVNSGQATGSTITFDPIVFPASGPQRVIALSAAVGPLNLNASMAIVGPGAAALAIDGGCTAGCGTPAAVGGTTIANVGFGGSSPPTVAISDLTIRNGNGAADSNNGGGGGGINNTGTLHIARVTFRTNTGVNGGALTNSADEQSNSPGILTVADSAFVGNAAVSIPNQGPAGLGGGIASAGTLTVANSTFTANTAQGSGGAIANANSATVTNSTFQGNSAPAGGAVVSLVGFPGITPHVTLINVTVSGNTATQHGGGLDTGVLVVPTTAPVGAKPNRTPFARAAPVRSAPIVGSITLTNTLVAGNTGGDIGGDGNPAAVTGDHTLIGDGSGGLTAANGNLLGTAAAPLNPLLGPLGTYGSANGTQTLPLLPGSPAIDAGGTGGGVPATDQRGRPRVGAPDIGAFESQGFVITPTGTPQSAVVNTAFALPLTATVAATNAGEPVQGGVVTFTVAPVAGATAALSAPIGTIGANGQVSVTATANGVKGTYTVLAAARGAASGTFTLTNTAPLVRITVTANGGGTPTLKVGQVAAFVATGTYADNSTADITGQVTWGSDAPTVASVGADGAVTGQSPGEATIAATQGSIGGQARVTVSAPTPIGIQPAPAPASRPGAAGSPPGAAPAPAPAPRP